MQPGKLADPIDDKVSELEAIHQHILKKDKRLAKQVKGDLLKLKAGHSAEGRAAHLLDKHHLDSKRSIVLHDLRLEFEGDVAQIDHLRINRFGYVTLFETKSFSTGLKIDDDGVCWRWDQYRKVYEEIPSPLLQSKRHEVTVRKALEFIGYKVTEVIHFVLIDYKASLEKPKHKDFDTVCRPDRLEEAENKFLDRFRAKDLVIVPKTIGRLISSNHLYSEEDLKKFARSLNKLHKPIMPDYWARYGLERPKSAVAESVKAPYAVKVQPETPTPPTEELLSSHKVAKQLGLGTEAFLARAAKAGLAEEVDGHYQATERGKKFGAENRVFRKRPYIAWPVSMIDKLSM